MRTEATRGEIRAQLDRLAAEVDALRAQRSLLTYRLEQTVRERNRLERHLEVVARGEGEREGAA